jgi:hypothetical protein
MNVIEEGITASLLQAGHNVGDATCSSRCGDNTAPSLVPLLSICVL